MKTRLSYFRLSTLAGSVAVAVSLGALATAEDDVRPSAATLNLASPGLALPTDSPPTASSRQASSQSAGAADRARYRKFGDKWWYWLPSKQWALWDGGKWTIPSPKASEYQEWRQQQFAGRYTDSAALDETMRRREVDRWRGMAAPQSALVNNDSEHKKQVDRFHDKLMITPYDYRIGTEGHGLFDCDPDRVIANTGRFNYATSNGGYMGGALRSPYGY